MVRSKLSNTTITFATNIRIERAKKRLSQEALAEMANVSRETIGAIEREETVPSLEVAVSIARALNVDISDLLK